jgi:hypothetical protein
MTDPILTAAASLGSHPYPCCEHVARVVRRAYGLDADLRYADGSAWWQLANVWDLRQPWSAAWAYMDVAVGIMEAGGERDVYIEPGTWAVCQGWRRLSGPGGTVGPGDTGHTWLWYATSPTHGVVLDSSTTRGPRLGGVAFTGQALPAGRPWAERVAAYPAGLAVAVLRPPER